MNELTKRQLSEMLFHDQWARLIKLKEIYYNESFESPTAIENKYIISRMLSLKKKTILDLGCGMGDATIYFAKKGAKVYAIDISQKMIQLVKKLSKVEKVSNFIHANQGRAESLDFKNNHFDFIYGNGILHHVDLHSVAKEVRRVLKLNGQAYFIEPLSYNIIIDIYRKLALKVRSEYEKPLSLEDIDKFCKHFKKFSKKEFHFFTLLIFIWFFIVERINPNKERYWKKIIIEGNKYEKAFQLLHQLDSLLLEKVPFLKRFCWTVVITVQK